MGRILASFIMPHPPLAVPEVGRGQEARISETISMMKRAAGEIRGLKPDTVIVISPHAPMCREKDCVHIYEHETLRGNLSNFGAWGIDIGYVNDYEFVASLILEAESAGFRAGGTKRLRGRGRVAGELQKSGRLQESGAPQTSGGPHADGAPQTNGGPQADGIPQTNGGLQADGASQTNGGLHAGCSTQYASATLASDTADRHAVMVPEKGSGKLDHGTIVPLYYVDNAPGGADFKLVVVSIAFMGSKRIYEFGKCIKRAVQGYSAGGAGGFVVIASCDLSHKLKADGPYGFDPEGPRFDKYFIECIKTGDVDRLVNIDEDLLEAAAQCGYYGTVMMLGAMDGLGLAPEVYSYEGTFGVGYPVAKIAVD